MLKTVSNIQCSFYFTTLDPLGREHLLQLTAARVRLHRSTVGVIEERLRSIISELYATDTAISMRKFLLNDNRYYIWGKPTKFSCFWLFAKVISIHQLYCYRVSISGSVRKTTSILFDISPKSTINHNEQSKFKDKFDFVVRTVLNWRIFFSFNMLEQCLRSPKIRKRTRTRRPNPKVIVKTTPVLCLF